MKLRILRIIALTITVGAALILTNDTPSNAQTEIPATTANTDSSALRAGGAKPNQKLLSPFANYHQPSVFVSSFRFQIGLKLKS